MISYNFSFIVAELSGAGANSKVTAQLAWALHNRVRTNVSHFHHIHTSRIQSLHAPTYKLIHDTEKMS
jgi:hypothetical protein